MSLIQNVFWTISSTQHILLSVCMLIKCVCYIFISLISIELIIIKRSDSFTISKNWIGEMLIWRLIMNRRIGWLQLFYIIHSNGLCHSFHEHNHKKSELEDGIVILSIVVQDDLYEMTYIVIIAGVYQIGHTAKGRTNYDDSFIKRAVIDLYLLSRCGYLTVTKRSSFGDTAVILSSANAVFQISCHVCWRNRLIYTTVLSSCTLVSIFFYPWRYDSLEFYCSFTKTIKPLMRDINSKYLWKNIQSDIYNKSGEYDYFDLLPCDSKWFCRNQNQQRKDERVWKKDDVLLHHMVPENALTVLDRQFASEDSSTYHGYNMPVEYQKLCYTTWCESLYGMILLLLQALFKAVMFIGILSHLFNTQ